MPNNFRLTGNYYVSKAGNDANAGTSAEAPKRTIQSALTAMTSNQTLVIGAGVYAETISKTIGTYSITVVADGEVILDGSNASATFSCANQGFVWSFTGITFKNYSSISINNNNIGIHNNFISRCNFINSTFYVGGSNTTSGVSFTTCKFINSSCVGNVGLDYFNLSLFVNSSVSNCLTFTNCYIENSSILTLNSTITAANFNFNNLQGSIVMNVASSVTTGVIQDTYNRYYDLSQAGNGGSGSLAEPYKRADTLGKRFNFSNHRIAYPTMNASSSAVDPKFNSIEDQDFTLQADSWHISRASDGISNIGGTNYALRRAANISFSGSSATVDPSLIFQYNNYVISGSQVTGSITSAPIAVSPLSSSKVIQKVTYNGLLAFNKDTGSASGSNQNVPDFDTFTSASGNAAANPDRLVYYMRHTTGSSIPVSDAGWDNGGLWTAGQYNVFEWNTKPSIDNLGVGNGSGSFNAAASPTYIQATYVQMRVRLRNDYLL